MSVLLRHVTNEHVNEIARLIDKDECLNIRVKSTGLALLLMNDPETPL